MQAALAKQVVTHEVSAESGPVHHRDHRTDVQQVAEVRHDICEDPAPLGGLGGNREVHDDRRPASVAARDGKPLEGRHQVLAQGTRDSPVVEIDVDPLDDTGDVADDAGEQLTLDLDLDDVMHRDGVRGIPLQTHHRVGHRVGLDTGDQQQRGGHASIP